MNTMQHVCDLMQDDYFLHRPAGSMGRAQSEIGRLNHLRSSLDIPTIGELDYNTMLGWQMMFAEPHVVECVAIATGDRVSRRLTDGKRFVWRADCQQPVLVEFSSDRNKFDAMVDELKRRLKEHNEEIAKLSKRQKKAKKMNKPEELVERTEVTAT